MNGRQIFEKYEKAIGFMLKATFILPKGLRKSCLNMLRYRNGTISMFSRYLLLSSLAEHVGKNVSIFPGVYFEHIERLRIGDNVSIHQMCYIDAEGGVDIGSDVSIAHRCTILSSNHSYQDKRIPIKYQKMNLNKTVLKNNIWIGCGCTILAGVEIGDGCVIGANSTVTRSIPENSVAVGSPAKRIKSRIQK